jgi:DNA modification methylase
MAAKDLGRAFMGIERQAKWADVARARVGLSPEDPGHVRDDNAQQGLEAYTDGGGSDE